MAICVFCKSEFCDKSTLNKHQKTSKYCIKIQLKNDPTKIIDTTCNQCTFCTKKLTTRYSLNSHLNTCKVKKRVKEEENKLKSVEEKVEKLTQEIIQLKEKPVTIINNTLFEQKIAEKNEYILKLEEKIEKYENKFFSMASEPKTTKNTVVINTVDEREDIPIPIMEQMRSIIIEEVKDDVEYSNISLNDMVISSRPIDHYVNATQLCQAGGKKFNDWFRLDITKELINELFTETGIPVSLLVESNRGRTSKYTQGSWIHPDLSIQLAQWISPKFAIQVSKWIRSLFTEGSIEIDRTLLREKDHRIKQLESVCLSKQRRVEYPEKNVIYILTTDDHIKRRTYIIGKAKNLTQRLSTYNKTCDHTVVHYRECKNEEDMSTSETIILNKLKDYREQANRDRFILPDDKDILFFTNVVDQCIEFI